MTLIEGKKYEIEIKGKIDTYLYRGKDMGGAHTFVKAVGLGMYKTKCADLSNIKPSNN